MVAPVCGIAGKVGTDGPVDAALLMRMCDVIRHRGPDSHGTFIGEGAGLGARRLAVIDVEGGDQPVYNEDGSVVVVHNGEIYNYRELRADLERAGHRLASRTDTEVIAHLYEDLGDDCVHRLRGMFAFALWDRRRRRLLVARDRVGKKPLVYAQRGRTLWFGSEAKSILEDADIPRDIDYDAVDTFLHFGYVPDPLSTFAAVRKLPPGHILTWEDGRVSTRRYWRLSYSGNVTYGSQQELDETIREALLEATRLRLRSDVPLGAFLSGGVDSTAVVAAMSRESSGTVKTFSIGFDVDRFDETAYAREVSELFGTEHHEFRLTPDVIEILPKLVWHYGEPFADASAVPTLYLAEATRRHVTVALNGDGGDETFAGYDHYFPAVVADRLRWVPTSVARKLASIADATGGTAPRLALVRRARWLANAVALDVDDRYTWMRAYVSEADRRNLYSDDFRAQLERGGRRSAPNVIRDAMHGSDAPTALERMLDADVQTYLPSDLLVKVDIATMAHSLEARSPLLDHKFMELVAGLPAAQKLRGRTTKVALKNALRAWVPGHILDRPKMGFSIPLAEWLRGRLRELPGDVLLDERSLGRGLFREEALRSLIDRHIDGSAENSRTLWALLQLELWFRTYIDSAAPAPVALDAVSR